MTDDIGRDPKDIPAGDIETCVKFACPPHLSQVQIGGRGAITITLPTKRPCLWFRLWQRIFLGFVWIDLQKK